MSLKGHAAGRLWQGSGAQAGTQPGVGGIKSGGALGVLRRKRQDLGVSGTTWVDAGGESRPTGWAASSFLHVHSHSLSLLPGPCAGASEDVPSPHAPLKAGAQAAHPAGPPAGPAQITEGQGSGRDRKEPGMPPRPAVLDALCESRARFACFPVVVVIIVVLFLLLLLLRAWASLQGVPSSLTASAILLKHNSNMSSWPWDEHQTAWVPSMGLRTSVPV